MAQQVISFHYKLTDKGGKLLDASQADRPLIFCSGTGQIIPGLENILTVMAAGEQKTVTVPAKDAYGIHNPALIYKVRRDQLPKPDLKLGDMFEVGQGEQYFPVSVVEIDGEDITLDGNHPLAGQDLTFAVNMVSIRSATTEEISHGHVHGVGGCEH